MTNKVLFSQVKVGDLVRRDDEIWEVINNGRISDRGWYQMELKRPDKTMMLDYMVDALEPDIEVIPPTPFSDEETKSLAFRLMMHDSMFPHRRDFDDGKDTYQRGTKYRPHWLFRNNQNMMWMGYRLAQWRDIGTDPDEDDRED